MDKPKVGDKLFSLNIGNAARNTPQTLTPVEVTKVGRKYFTTCGEHRWSERQYHMDSFREKSNYSANSVLYRTEQEYEDEKESYKISTYISKAFQYGRNVNKLPLEALRGIERIIAGEECLQEADE